MKTVTIEQVIKVLVKRGHNPRNAKTWAEEHFEYVSKHYTGASKMAEVIMSL